jgi:hypothetical protein
MKKKFNFFIILSPQRLILKIKIVCPERIVLAGRFIAISSTGFITDSFKLIAKLQVFIKIYNEDAIPAKILILYIRIYDLISLN